MSETVNPKCGRPFETCVPLTAGECEGRGAGFRV